MTANAEAKLNFKPRVSGAVNLPDAPEGGWKAHIPKGSSKVTATQAGDPQIHITFRLVTALEPANVTHQGAEIVQRSFVPDDADVSKRKGANMQRGWRMALCKALNVKYEEVWPDMSKGGNEHSFDKFIAAIEGKDLVIYTTNSKRTMQSGEEVTNTDVRFTKPGAPLSAPLAVADDNPDRPSAKKR